MALKSGEAVLLQKNELMLSLFRAHLPYYEGMLTQPPNLPNHQ
jgi:hypothetical protein